MFFTLRPRSGTERLISGVERARTVWTAPGLCRQSIETAWTSLFLGPLPNSRKSARLFPQTISNRATWCSFGSTPARADTSACICPTEISFMHRARAGCPFHPSRLRTGRPGGGRPVGSCHSLNPPALSHPQPPGLPWGGNSTRETWNFLWHKAGIRGRVYQFHPIDAAAPRAVAFLFWPMAMRPLCTDLFIGPTQYG